MCHCESFSKIPDPPYRWEILWRSNQNTVYSCSCFCHGNKIITVRTGLYFWENSKGFIAVSAQSLCKGAIDSMVKIDCYINFIVPYSRNIFS